MAKKKNRSSRPHMRRTVFVTVAVLILGGVIVGLNVSGYLGPRWVFVTTLVGEDDNIPGNGHDDQGSPVMTALEGVVETSSDTVPELDTDIVSQKSDKIDDDIPGRLDDDETLPNDDNAEISEDPAGGDDVLPASDAELSSFNDFNDSQNGSLSTISEVSDQLDGYTSRQESLSLDIVDLRQRLDALTNRLDEFSDTWQRVDNSPLFFVTTQLWRIEQAIQSGDTYFTMLQTLVGHLPLSEQDLKSALIPVPTVASLHADLLSSLDAAQTFESRYDLDGTLKQRFLGLIRWQHDTSEIAGITLADFRAAVSESRLQAIAERIVSQGLTIDHPLHDWSGKYDRRQERLEWLRQLWRHVALEFNGSANG